MFSSLVISDLITCHFFSHLLSHIPSFLFSSVLISFCFATVSCHFCSHILLFLLQCPVISALIFCRIRSHIISCHQHSHILSFLFSYSVISVIIISCHLCYHLFSSLVIFVIISCHFCSHILSFLFSFVLTTFCLCYNVLLSLFSYHVRKTYPQYCLSISIRVLLQCTHIPAVNYILIHLISMQFNLSILFVLYSNALS